MSQQPFAPAKTLPEALLAQQAQLELLELELDRERELLCAGQPDGKALMDSAERKQSCFQALQSLDATAESVQRSLGFADGVEGRAAAARDQRCHLLLQRVLDAASRVYRLNTRNGTLLRTRMAWNERILEFIRDAQDTWIYGPQGKTAKHRTTISSQA